MIDWLERYGSFIFIGVPLVCYVLQAYVYYLQGRLGSMTMMLGYAAANVGIMVDTRKPH